MDKVKSLRHRAEMPAYVVGIFVNTIAIIILLGISFSGIEMGETISEYQEQLPFLLVFPGIILVYLLWGYAQIRASAILINEKQFPEVYEMYRDLALEIGFDKNSIPRLYLLQGNGQLNAYVTKCDLKRSYAVIYADIFEIVKKHGDYTTLKFILAHELGHIALGHVNIRRQILVFFANLFPPFSNTFTRSQELSADRVAAHFCPEGIDQSLLILSAGKNLYPDVNRDAYLEQAREKQGLFLRAVNLMSSHPIMPKRILALDEIKKHGLKKHGELF